MLLHGSPSSPFARKVMVVIHELGLGALVRLEVSDPARLCGNPAEAGSNPLAQLPTLIDGDEAIYDSAVICAWLEARAGRRLSSETGFDALRILRDQALGDGLLDASVILRQEEVLRRPDARRPDWFAAQSARVDAGLLAMAARLPGRIGKVDLGAVTFACLLDYLDFRHPRFDWRRRHPALRPWQDFWSARESFRATAFQANPALAGGT